LFFKIFSIELGSSWRR